MGAASLATSLSIAEQPVASLKGRIKKSLKFGMIGGELKSESLEEKFKAAKAAGFEGVEFNAPGFDVAAVKQAIDATGFPVDGSVVGNHWKIRHTDPDPAIRQQALDSLKQALKDTHAVGGDTVLLVVGHGKDGPEEEIWKRSVENIRQAVPLAEELGMTIAIENVWNQFCYSHSGPLETQTADKLARYCDEFESPHVAMQFDLGNHWKYGPTGDWIRTLGHRVVKLDIKGFSRETGKFCHIGKGDVDWADVRAALTEIDFKGWCAAEVGGGGAKRLAEVSANMSEVFGL